jgi:hypothetical protein
MRPGKRLALPVLAAVVLTVFVAVPAASAQDRPEPQGPHSDNMRLVGASLRAGAPFGPPPEGPGTVPWDTRNTDLAFWKKTVIQGRYDGFRVIDVSNPRRPRELAHFPCVSGQGDVSVYKNLVIRSVDAAVATDTCSTTVQPSRPTDCAPVTSPCIGFEGIQIFDIRNLNNIRHVASVPLDCGSHTNTLVPDERNRRVLIYNSVSGVGRQTDPGKYGNQCPGEPFGREDIVEIPLYAPEDAEVIGSVDLGELEDGTPMEACHDFGVILGKVDLAACAGHPMGIAVFDMDDLEEPEFLHAITEEGTEPGQTVHGWHSAAFSWDGEILIGGWEPGGGTQPRCQVTGTVFPGNPDEGPFQTDEMKTLFFYDTESGEEIGRHVLPRPQSQYENCTMHNYNIAPDKRRGLLVHGSYQSGTALVDFTDTDDIYEVAFMDPPPLDPPTPTSPGGRSNFRGGDWASYWYNGLIYESDARRGLYIWEVRAPEVKRGKQVKLDFLNPQTQHLSLDDRRRGRGKDKGDRWDDDRGKGRGRGKDKGDRWDDDDDRGHGKGRGRDRDDDD